MEITLTTTADIANHSQVESDLDRHGWSASKLWNVGKYYTDRVWEKTGRIPEEDELKSELKEHGKYKDLHSQSSQKVLEELSEAFNSWYGSEDERDNPPGYRKQWYHDQDGNVVHEEHPRSTITWKNRGIKHDSEHNRLRLSKGKNHKQSEESSNFILAEYDLHRPDNEIEGSIQQVRAVYEDNEWKLHIVTKQEIEQSEESGDKIAGIDLGISNIATVSFGDETVLYPANKLRQDRHYFTREEYSTEGENGPSRKATLSRTKKERRKEHFLHTLSKHIVEECVKRDVGVIGVGHPKNVRRQDWGRHGNKRLHNWAFEKLIGLIEYKASVRGIDVRRIDEKSEKTSQTCCVCGKTNGSHRVERGLYVCEECGLVANGDCNGAENHRTLTLNLLHEEEEISSYEKLRREGDRSNGCLAQPGVYLYDRTCGFVPQASVG